MSYPLASKSLIDSVFQSKQRSGDAKYEAEKYVKRVCGGAVCDRVTAQAQLNVIGNVVNSLVMDIQKVVATTTRLKVKPHSMVLHMKYVPANYLAGAQYAESIAKKTPAASQRVLVRAFTEAAHSDVAMVLHARARDVIERTQRHQGEDLLVVLEYVVHSCLDYQENVIDTINYNKMLVDSFQQLADLHHRFDQLLEQMPDGVDVRNAAVPEQLRTDILTTQNNMIQKISYISKINDQVVFALNRLREELDFMQIYMNADDSQMIHNFLGSDAVKKLVAGDKTLAAKYSRLIHDWSKILNR